MTSALAAAGYEGAVAVLAGAGRWPLIVRARARSADDARALARRLREPLAALQRTGLVGQLDVGLDREGEPLAILRMQVDDRLVVQLGGDDTRVAGDDEILLRVATGLGFGSGLHPSTITCLRQVGRHTRPGMLALDLGCGSGVVAVALARLGARVIAVDNDPMAVAAATETVRRNGVESSISVAAGSLGRAGQLGHWLGWRELEATPTVETEGRFDLIAANIFARVHVALATEYQSALRPGGILITAGYTGELAQNVSDALVAVGFECLDLAQEGEFVSLAHRHPATS